MIALTRPLGLESQNEPASSAVISIVTRSISCMTGGGDSRDTIHGVRNTKCPDRELQDAPADTRWPRQCLRWDGCAGDPRPLRPYVRPITATAFAKSPDQRD